MTQRALLATRSAGKLRELVPLFRAAGLDVADLGAAGLDELAEEEELEAFATFEENALAKARYFHRRSGGMPTFADDSGLAVDALGGAPGVHSKRWSADPGLGGLALDAANNELLLARLAGETNRRARYVCAAAYVDDGREIVRRGEVLGTITDRARGTNGFGYDPYFLCDELGRTFGEVGRREKELVSHRGRAFRALVQAVAGVEAR